VGVIHYGGLRTKQEVDSMGGGSAKNCRLEKKEDLPGKYAIEKGGDWDIHAKAKSSGNQAGPRIGR